MTNHEINPSGKKSNKQVLTVAKMKEILNKVDDNALIIFENKKSREIVKDLFLEKQFYLNGTESVRLILLSNFLNSKVREND